MIAYLDKHKSVLKNKKDIIKQYKDYVPTKLIAREYGVTRGCIYQNLRDWGIKRENGI